MKLTKILFVLSTAAFAQFSHAADDANQADAVIQMPAMIVEATRLPDPLTMMRATLQSTAVIAPSHVRVKLPLFAQSAPAEDRSGTTSTSRQSGRRRARIL